MHRLCAGFGALLGLGWVALLGSAPGNTGQARAAAEIALREGLVIRPVGRYGRSPIHTDAIQAQMVAGKWAAPKAGAASASASGS